MNCLHDRILALVRTYGWTPRELKKKLHRLRLRWIFSQYFFWGVGNKETLRVLLFGECQMDAIRALSFFYMKGNFSFCTNLCLCASIPEFFAFEALFITQLNLAETLYFLLLILPVFALRKQVHFSHHWYWIKGLG